MYYMCARRPLSIHIKWSRICAVSNGKYSEYELLERPSASDAIKSLRIYWPIELDQCVSSQRVLLEPHTQSRSVRQSHDLFGQIFVFTISICIHKNQIAYMRRLSTEYTIYIKKQNNVFQSGVHSKWVHQIKHTQSNTALHCNHIRISSVEAFKSKLAQYIQMRERERAHNLSIEWTSIAATPI